MMTPFDPAGLAVALHPDASLWLQILVIILGTLVSEDLTCIAVGLLIRQGQMDLSIGLLGCFSGILLGDLGLWWIGRVVGHTLLPRTRLDDLGRWLDRRAFAAVVAARFVPGLRLPLYLAAGAMGRDAIRFAFWAALACLIWTPLLVLATMVFGEVAVSGFASLLGHGWSALLLGTGAIYLIVRVALLACTSTGRGKLLATLSRLWRWEFWPSWLFYLPLLPWLAYLSVRYRGALVWTAANPGIPQGGVVGESKFAILRQLPSAWIVPSVLVPPGKSADRVELVRQALAQSDWKFPLILKPDAAQRGAGVKKVHDLDEVEQYLLAQPAAVVVQPYHPGPHEAGIFYYRLPGEERGYIFSVTDKVFPVLIGDGRATLEELIWRHPRYRMQAEVFLARHQDQRQRILPDGERLTLAVAGNHCQGTLFRDGSHLITPQLTRAVDAITREFDGFFIGRFDVRYSNVEAFQAGRDLAIVELNGVTSESTNIYDPSRSLLGAYRTLFSQWSLLYRIGHANRQRGHRPTGMIALLRLILAYYRQRQIDPLSS